MKFHVQGANKNNGSDVDLQLVATDSKHAEQIAMHRGIMVSLIERIEESAEALSPIAFIDEPEPATVAAAGTVGAHAGASDAHESHATGNGHANEHHDASHNGHAHDANHAAGQHHDHPHHEGHHEHHTATPHSSTHLEYKLMQNQALYLLEKSVNKMILEGWEPIGGLTIAIQNNAPNYFQALIRHPKVPEAATA